MNRTHSPSRDGASCALRFLRSALFRFLPLLLLPALALRAQSALQWQALQEPGVGGWVTSVAYSPHNSSVVLVAGDMLGIGRSTDAGSTWRRTSDGLNGYEIAEFTFHPSQTSTVWAATMEGPYKSTDAGLTWTLKDSGLPIKVWGEYHRSVQKILIDPKNSNRLLAFAGNRRDFKPERLRNTGAVWVSTNGGESWSLLSRIDPANTGPGRNVRSAVYAAGSGSTTLYAAVGGMRVMRSTDDGATWHARSNGLPSGVTVHALAAHPTQPGTLWAALSDGQRVYKTTDGGANWFASGSGMPTSGTVTSLAVAANGSLLVATNSKEHSIHRSNDGGASWSRVNAGVDEPYFWSMTVNYAAIRPGQNAEVIAVSNVSIFRSTNFTATTPGSVTWTDTSAYRPVGAAAAHWRSRGFSGLVGNKVTFNPFNPNISVLSAMDDGKVLVSRDNQITWKARHQNVTVYDHGYDASFAGPGGSVVYAAIGQHPKDRPNTGLVRSSDGGQTWTQVTRPAGTQGHCSAVYANPASPDHVLAIYDNRLFRSTTGGASWTQIPVYLNGNQVTNLQAVTGNGFTSAPTAYYVAGRSGAWRSTDGGLTWAIISSQGIGSDGQVRLAISPAAPHLVYRVLWNTANDNTSGIDRWNNNNSTWTWLSRKSGSSLSSQSIANIFCVAIDPIDANRIAIATNEDPFHDRYEFSGVWLSENGGASFAQRNSGLGVRRLRSLAFSPDGSRLVAGTNGGGYYTANVASRPVRHEAELLAIAGSSGDNAYTAPEAPASGGAAFFYASDAVGDQVTLGPVPIFAGSREVSVRYKRFHSRGIIQVSWSTHANGSFTSLGTIDMYGAETYLEAALGSINTTHGEVFLRFQVVGKNSWSSGHTMGLDRVSFTPTGSSFASWAAERFDAEQLADAAISGPEATPDHDGVPNLLKYAVGLEPGVPASASPLVLLPAAESVFEARFHRARAELLYEVLASVDLQAWEVAAVNPGEVGGLVSVPLGPLSSEHPRRFVRLRVSSLAPRTASARSPRVRRALRDSSRPLRAARV